MNQIVTTVKELYETAAVITKGVKDLEHTSKIWGIVADACDEILPLIQDDEQSFNRVVEIRDKAVRLQLMHGQAE